MAGDFQDRAGDHRRLSGRPETSGRYGHTGRRIRRTSCRAATGLLNGYLRPKSYGANHPTARPAVATTGGVAEPEAAEKPSSPYRVTAHGPLHSLANWLKTAGTPNHDIQALLRHTDYRTTAGYLNPRELQQMGEKPQVA